MTGAPQGTTSRYAASRKSPSMLCRMIVEDGIPLRSCARLDKTTGWGSSTCRFGASSQVPRRGSRSGARSARCSAAWPAHYVIDRDKEAGWASREPSGLHRRRDRARRQDGQGRRRRHHGRGQRLQGSVQGARGRDEERRARVQSRQAGRGRLRGLCRAARHMFKGNRKLLEDVLEGLFHIAKADESCIRARRSSSPGRQALRLHRHRVR